MSKAQPLSAMPTDSQIRSKADLFKLASAVDRLKVLCLLSCEGELHAGCSVIVSTRPNP